MRAVATVGTEFAERPTSHINENDMNEQEVENELSARGADAPRVTPDAIDRVIDRVDYFRVPNTTMTVCAIVTRNGFAVTGESACASEDTFDEEIGRRLAYEDARRKVWPLEGYLLRERMRTERRHQPTDASPHPQPIASVKMVADSMTCLPTVASVGAACADLRSNVDAARSFTPAGRKRTRSTTSGGSARPRRGRAVRTRTTRPAARPR